MIIKNYTIIALSLISKRLGRGKYFRKKIFSSKNILEKNYQIKSDFSFLQVGANDGISFDFLYDFVVKRNSSGIVIEPVKEYFDELYNNYKNHSAIIKINKAVHKNKKRVTIYKVDLAKINYYPEWVKGIASFNISNITKFGFINKDHIQKEVVLADKLMNLINSYNVSYFDYFQIDTEGYDYEIIKMFDFKIFKPNLIKAEFINLNDIEKKLMRKILKNNGYYVFQEGLDIVGVNLKKISL